VGSKQRSIPYDESSLAAMFRRVGEEQLREAASGAKQAEGIVREALGDEAGGLLSALPPEDRAPAAYEMFQRIKDGWMNVDDAASWLLIRVRQKQRPLEQAVNAAAVIKAERSSGGKASSAARRERWQLWQHWVSSQPFPEGPKFQRDIVSVLRAKASGKPDEGLEQKWEVPADLPVIHGQNGKPPGERSIRQRLFGAK
jgi:hypothetical protein